MLRKPQTQLALLAVSVLLLLYAANSQFNPDNSDVVVNTPAPVTSAKVALKNQVNQSKSEPDKIGSAQQRIVAADLATASNSTETQMSFINVSDARPTKAPKEIKINSLDELSSLFDSLNYNTQSWIDGNREVPRLTFESVSERWQETSNNIPVQQKKMVFFRLIAPLILVANENILLERRLIESAPLDDIVLLNIAAKYRIITRLDQTITEQQRQMLLEEIDILPPSLVLAQAAEESGWATSRFTVEGNAFFGQWDFSGNGMIPKQQRKELGNYGLARFDTPLASVEGYMLNLNTNNAYKKLRSLRASLRASNAAITGIELAGTLDKYSERGQAYIDGIRQMIRYNKLDQVDEAYLSDAAPLHLLSSAKQ
ncbi:glucosaminidase domain-containing protein [Shewanella gelidimarina]|uniref:glucosaminidase domain-containing protein n=1 Tax=Shewanella gelidimarina TaxID=56813 RepID=UPI00200EB8F5|nr:glucosaminidase domain-containing protein [Shewanella gelidimarina]MCL1056872.1 glucosaminidase domain-containing protein [Shewanella gelidimarina]